MWIEYDQLKPELGIEVIAQSDNWIIEDYNPKGIRIGFQNGSTDDDGHFISAYFCNYQDFYNTDYDTLPTRWKHIIPNNNPRSKDIGDV